METESRDGGCCKTTYIPKGSRDLTAYQISLFRPSKQHDNFCSFFIRFSIFNEAKLVLTTSRNSIPLTPALVGAQVPAVPELHDLALERVTVGHIETVF